MEGWLWAFIVRLPLFSMLSRMSVNFFYIGKELSCLVESMSPFESILSLS